MFDEDNLTSEQTDPHGKPSNMPDNVEPTLDAQQSSQAEQLVQALDFYLEELKAGNVPDREQLLADHPEVAEQLETCLAGIDFIQSVPTDSEDAPKTLGDFRIIREVGRGGMGAVYEAEQISLGRIVALKVLRFGSVSDPQALERFQREAETVAQLHHTNIVPVFSVGHENGVNFYAMQFIDGPSLDAVLKENDGPIDSQRVAEWGLQAAEALAHAHDRDVIHRDVKPSNLILDKDSRIWLTNFGLAKRSNDLALSMTGALLGTPRYMSPEQASSATRRVDHRTDLYSLGATLYQLVTGKPVFAADTPHGIISQILTEEPRPPRQHRADLPRDLETILMKCLAKDANERYMSAQKLVDDLRAFLDGRPIAARRAGAIELAVRWVKRQRRSVALTSWVIAATLLTVLVTGFGGYYWHRGRLAYVSLDTENPPMIAELLYEDGQPAVPAATVPTQPRVELPAGDYQLRLTQDRRLSQEFSISLEHGKEFAHKLDLEDQMLWGDLEFERTFRLVRANRPGGSIHTDILLLNGKYSPKGW
jgi:predicted Ser/Thr protein kinase